MIFPPLQPWRSVFDRDAFRMLLERRRKSTDAFIVQLMPVG